MIKKILLSLTFIAYFIPVFSQIDSTKKQSNFTFSGYVDAYFRNPLNSPADQTNNFTSFTNTKNQLQLGMASFKVDYSKNNIYGTIDLGYGKRASEFSYNDNGLLSNIKQAYLSYSITEQFKITGGKWATHIGYELLDAPYNRNYSMSYGFSYGPFFHTGVKAEYAFTGKSSLMIGIANPTDYVASTTPLNVFIAQYSNKLFNDKTTLFLNYQGGKIEGNNSYQQIDVVVTQSVGEKWSLHYDGTLLRANIRGEKNNWKSHAGYLNFDFNKQLGFTYRIESFYDKKAISAGAFGTEILANTLSVQYKIKKILFIPEIRFEDAKDKIFYGKDGTATQKTAGLLIAAIYKF